MILGTNQSLTANEIWEQYKRRGDAENRIKELKEVFGVQGFCMDDFCATVPGMNIELAFDSVTIYSISGEYWKKEIADGKIFLTPGNKNAGIIKIVSSTGQLATLVLLTWQQAKNSWRIKIKGQERLLISQAGLMFYGDNIECRQLGNPDISFKVFPAFDKAIYYHHVKVSRDKDGIFQHYIVRLASVSPNISLERLSKSSMEVSGQGYLPPTLSDIILKINYQGGHAEASIHYSIVTDNLFNGQSWTFGLKRYLKQLPKNGIKFQVFLWSDKITGVPDSLVQQVENNGPQIQSVKVIPQYRIKLTVK